MSYKPYRVLKRIVTVVDDGDDTLACYPHGKVGARMIATGKIGIVFCKGVINAPTEEEIALFNLPALSESVKPIPQGPHGIDSRLSGVARSIKGSQRGREAGIVETFERKAAKVKPKPDKKDEPVAVSMPEDPPECVGPLIEDLEYLNHLAKKSLSERGITKIGQLHGWTADGLNELPGIGAKLAEKLLADYEACPETAEPVIDETKEEGDLNE